MCGNLAINRWKVASGLNRMNQTTSEGGAQAKEYLAIYSEEIDDIDVSR